MLRLNTRDEFGRTQGMRQGFPLTSPLFTPRESDRTSAFTRDLKPEAIASAFRAADDGDLEQQMDLFDLMLDKDPELAGIYQQRILTPAGIKWSVVPAVGEDRPEFAKAQKAAAYAHAVAQGITGIRQAIVKLNDAVGKGVSALEIDWLADKTIDQLRWISPKRFRFDWNRDQQRERFLIIPDGDEYQTREGIEPPAFKVMIHRTNTRAAHSTRAGILRPLAFPWVIKNFAMKDWSTFSEVFGMPVKAAKYPPGTNPTDRRELLEMVRRLGTEGAAVFDSRVELQFVEAVNRGSAPYDALIAAVVSQYAIGIVGQELTATAQPTGLGSGVANVQQGVRQDLMEADCEDMAETLRAQLLYPIVGYGIGWETASELCPVWKFHYEPAEDRTSEIGVDKVVLVDMGLGRSVTKGAVAKKYGWELMPGVDANEALIPEAAPVEEDPDEEDQEDPERDRKTLEKALAGKLRMTKAEVVAIQKRLDQSATAGQQALDGMVDGATRVAVLAFRELAAPLQALVATAESLEELQVRIERAYDDMPAERLEEMVRRSVYVAYLFGRAEAERRTDGPAAS